MTFLDTHHESSRMLKINRKNNTNIPNRKHFAMFFLHIMTICNNSSAIGTIKKSPMGRKTRRGIYRFGD